MAAAVAVICSSQTVPGDDALWREFGLVQKTEATVGKASATVYRIKDVTGALAAWEWQRAAEYHACALEAFCSTNGKRSVVAIDNYLIALDGPVMKPDLEAFAAGLPNRHDTSLPAILTFIPRKNLVPNSARYVLGPDSLKAFAPALASVQPGFEQGAEAQVAQYKVGKAEPINLAVFYYPTPEMARLHTSQFRGLPGVHVKRSNVLLAVVFGGVPDQQANALLGQIEYEAHIRWNETPPPSPIKPLYLLIRNIIFLSIVLGALCFVAGLIYAGIRLYRRRFGTLEDEEAMTTLHLSGD